jgi:hypothetical protein
MGLALASDSGEVATPIDISYAAHTASCTFLLDDEGICRRIVMAPKGKRRESSQTALKCVGAQYVASLDGSAAGGLVEMPRVGAAMLFAHVDERGRVSLVRTSVLTSFESRAGEDPFVSSQSVETSAPALEMLETPRVDRHGDRRDPDYFDPSERTQRIQALRAEDFEDELELEEDPLERTSEMTNEMGNDLATAEYQSVAGTYPPSAAASRRVIEGAPTRPLPAPGAASQAPTLRKLHRDTTIEGNDKYSRPPPSRGILPRRSSDPKQRAAASAGHAWEPHSSRTPPAYGSDVQVTRRRRGG